MSIYKFLIILVFILTGCKGNSNDMVTNTVKPSSQVIAISTPIKIPSTTPCFSYLKPEPYIFLTKWGLQKFNDRQSSSPLDIALDSEGNVCVGGYIEILKPDVTPTENMSRLDIEYKLYRIQKFSSNGEFIKKIDFLIGKKGQIGLPYAFTVDKKGNIYVVDYDNNCVHKFDCNGNFIRKIGSRGDGDGQFHHIGGICLDKKGCIYVAAPGQFESYIQKFDPDGKFIKKWCWEYGQLQFEIPVIAIDSSGSFYLVDTMTPTVGPDVYFYGINKLDRTGNWVKTWIGHKKKMGF